MSLSEKTSKSKRHRHESIDDIKEGKELKSSLHRHPLKKMQMELRICDMCGDSIDNGVVFHCMVTSCEWDACSPCFLKHNHSSTAHEISTGATGATGASSVTGDDNSTPPTPPVAAARPPASRKSGRGMAKMFHETNGRTLFGWLSPSTTTTAGGTDILDTNRETKATVQVGPAIVQEIKRRGQELIGTYSSTHEEILRTIAKEFGFDDPDGTGAAHVSQILQ